MTISYRKLRVFLCHASQDKSVVRELNRQLADEGWIAPWLDEERLLPGHDWDIEIEKAVEAADAVVVCLSSKSVNKEGYIQKELSISLNLALYKPEGIIFIIPLRLDDCFVPTRIKHIQFINYFPFDQVESAYKRLLDSLEIRAKLLDLDIAETKKYFKEEEEKKTQKEKIERINKEATEKARREEEEILRQEAEKRARLEIIEEVRKLEEEGKRIEAEEKAKREEELIQKKANEIFKRDMELLKRKREREEALQNDYYPNSVYEPRKRNNGTIIAIVSVVILCCFCSSLSILYYYGDVIFQGLGG